MEQEISVQVRFTMTDDETGISFSDALYFTLTDYPKHSAAQIVAMQQARFDAWKQDLQNQPQDAQPIDAGV